MVLRHPAPISIYIFAVILISFPKIISAVIRLPFNKLSCHNPALIPRIDSGRYPALITNNVSSVIRLSFLTFISAVWAFRGLSCQNQYSCRHPAVILLKNIPAVMPCRTQSVEIVFLPSSGSNSLEIIFWRHPALISVIIQLSFIYWKRHSFKIFKSMFDLRWKQYDLHLWYILCSIMEGFQVKQL
jgi:hypothetical protein